MAGDSQTGGGGSVHWSIDVDKVDYKRAETICEDHGDGRFHQRGRDRDGVARRDRFTVSIRIPDNRNEARKLRRLLGGADDGSQRGRVTFTLPIERHKDQIRITWGKQVAAKRQKVITRRHVAATPVNGNGAARRLAAARARR